jgi:hypothetical protein
MRTIFALLLPLFAVALPAHGQAYKCLKPDGSTQISSEPCSGGARTIKEVDEDVVPDDVRAKAERDAEKLRKRADRMEAERKADEADDRREQERQRKASGAPAPEAIQYCLNTIGRMNLDSNRRAELEAGCYATGRVEPVYTTPPPAYYGNTYYPAYPGYPHPPRPIQPIAPSNPGDPRPSPAAKPVDIYKVPSAPRAGSR